MRRPEDDEALNEEAYPYGDGNSRVYRASGGSRKNPMLLIIPHPHIPASVTCNRLKQFSDIRDIQAKKDGSGFRIDFSDITVIAKGRNLSPVAYALGAHACSFIQAFDSARHDPVSDATQSFIAELGYFTEDEAAAVKAAAA